MGTILDSSKEENDNDGVIKSIAFSVGGAEYLSRTLIVTDAGIIYDPADREFTSYDTTTGEFEITFSTAVPLLTGFRQITLTATDENGHMTEEQFTVFAFTEGPYVELTSPPDGERYESVVRIAGKVTNGIGTDSTSEVDPAGLRYRIGADIVQIVEFDNLATGEFYDPTTGEFVIDHVFNPPPTGGVTLEVTATDLAGYEGSSTRALVDQARSGLVFTSPGADTGGSYYYSSALSSAAEVTITVALSASRKNLAERNACLR